MTELAKDAAATDVTELLVRYSFELSGTTVDRLVDFWLRHYPIQWVRLAVIEALYQGRYKAVSVEQILNLWKRRGRSLYRFSHEFERIVCGRFPGSRLLQTAPLPSLSAQPSTQINRSQTNHQSFGRIASPLPKPLPPPIGRFSAPHSIAESPIAEPSSTQEPSPPLPSEAPLGEESLHEESFNQESLHGTPTREEAGSSANSEASSEASSSVDHHVDHHLDEPLNEPHLNTDDAGSDTGSDIMVNETAPQSDTALAKGSPVQPFKPIDDPELNGLNDISWVRATVPQQPIHQPIHQFIPTPSDSSDFYSKLKAVAHSTTASEGGLAVATSTQTESD